MLSNLCRGIHFLKRLQKANTNKIYRFIENTSKMTFIEKKDISCKNNIGIIRNL